MLRDNSKLLSEKVTLRALLLALGIALAGVVILWISISIPQGYPVWQALVRESGALLFITGVITLLWDLYGKRALLDEVLAKAQLSKDIDVAGIDRVMDSFQSRNLDWTPYFDKASTLDIFFAYGHTWRNTHLEDLKLLAGTVGSPPDLLMN
jgi:hypothetical protein